MGFRPLPVHHWRPTSASPCSCRSPGCLSTAPAPGTFSSIADNRGSDSTATTNHGFACCRALSSPPMPARRSMMTTFCSVSLKSNQRPPPVNTHPAEAWSISGPSPSFTGVTGRHHAIHSYTLQQVFPAAPLQPSLQLSQWLWCHPSKWSKLERPPKRGTLRPSWFPPFPAQPPSASRIWRLAAGAHSASRQLRWTTPWATHKFQLA